MKTLTKKLKQKWIDALKGGEYQQGVGMLHDGSGGYCCLGVLQAIDNEIIPESIYLLSGIGCRSCVRSLPMKVQNMLASMNDDGHSFNQIADWIDKNINPKR